MGGNGVEIVATAKGETVRLMRLARWATQHEFLPTILE